MAAISDLPSGQVINTEAVALAGGSINTDLGPATPSADHDAMFPYWRLVNALLEGQEAVVKGGQLYLPKHPEERDDDYKFRLANGVLTNIYADIIETLSSKPFDDEIQIVDGSAGVEFIGEPVKVGGKDTGKRKGGLIEDIDGKGSHLHVFLQNVFYHGISNAIDWIFVDYPAKAIGLTAAEERAKNIRPYWYRIPANFMLEVNTAIIGGKEVFTYARFLEYAKERKGWAMETKERVREIIRPLIKGTDNNPDDYGDPIWVLWEKDIDQTTRKIIWRNIGTGTYSIGEIPLVPFICGRRRGSSWVIDPPMKTAATLQVELYQLETGLKNVCNLVNYPMLAANGINLKGADGEQVEIVIGPHTVLNAPPDGSGNHGEWDFISPDASGMEFTAKRVEATKQELRELGRQPLTASSSALTVIASAFASQKANSAVEGWALMLKDAAENALALTAKWMNLTEEPEVRINTDFQVGVDDKSADQIVAMRESGDLSRYSFWNEMKRRNILSPDFDAEAEEELLKDELPSDDELDEAAKASGLDKSKPSE